MKNRLSFHKNSYKRVAKAYRRSLENDKEYYCRQMRVLRVQIKLLLDKLRVQAMYGNINLTEYKELEKGWLFDVGK